MRVNAFIIDEFYSNVDEVRQFALEQDFSVRVTIQALEPNHF